MAIGDIEGLIFYLGKFFPQDPDIMAEILFSTRYQSFLGEHFEDLTN